LQACTWPLNLPKIIFDEIVKTLENVTPAEAGVQNCLNTLDSRFRGNDRNEETAAFYETIVLEI